ncbi:MAG: sulfur oxidation c-type cytochrome SoxX [Deinococcales bacterium]
MRVILGIVFSLLTFAFAIDEASLAAIIAHGGENFANAAAAQDDAQLLCSSHHNQLPADLVEAFISQQKSLIAYPENGERLGDWESGLAIFSDSKKGNCYACHQGLADEVAAGNVGPSLLGYGARGQDEAIINYTYEKIFNAWVYQPCSAMYRAGVNGRLSPQETADLVGFLLAFESPLNANITANITQTPTPAVAALSAPETISAQASPVATPTPPAQAESPITQATLSSSELTMLTTPGVLVSFREGLESPSEGWQRVRPNQIGTIQSSEASGEAGATFFVYRTLEDFTVENAADAIKVTVGFPNQDYIAPASELRPVMAEGMRVAPGPDWSDGNLNGGTEGTVQSVERRGNTTIVRVNWDNGFSNRYFWIPDNYQVQAIALGNHSPEIGPSPIFISSKGFDEQLILGELIALAYNANHIPAEYIGPKDGTTAVRLALEQGEIDIYPEYTGTGLSNFFLNRGVTNLDKGITNNQELSRIVVSALDPYVYNINWVCPAPGNNTYAFAVRSAWAAEHSIYNVQDLADYINQGGEVKLASETEFARRPDGLASFEELYGFKFENFFDLGPTQAPYEAAVAVRDDVDGANVGVIYATDGTVQAFDLVVLSDTLGAQPVYNPTPTIRQSVIDRYPQTEAILCPVFDTLDNFALSSLNRSVTIDERDPGEVAKEYLCSLTGTEALSGWFQDDSEAAINWLDSCQ